MKALTMKPREVQKLLAPLVVQLIDARMKHAASKVVTDARAAAILAEREYRTERDGERVTDPKHGYRICDEQWDDYFARLDAANREAGWDGAPGTCPTLVLDVKVMEAEGALLKVARPLFGLGDEQPTILAQRDKFIELLCGLAFAKV